MTECNEHGKAIILTAFMKMTRNAPEIKPQVIEVFENYKKHFNCELQTRSCEYLKMLEMAGSGNSESSELVGNAIEKMPNFSQEIQTNSVLTKRILALKVKDGIHIDMAEAEREMQNNMGKLKVDKQLDASAPVEDSKSEPSNPAGSQDLNLLDLDLGGAQ